MKILHTADWHLGKRLGRFSRLPEQSEILEEICTIADGQQVDLVLIAGDLFDTFSPPTEATELFYRTLRKLSKNGKRPVIAIAGNHDSPYFIDAPNPLARACGIILIGHPNAQVEALQTENFEITNSVPGIFELKIKEIPFPVRIMHTAFANEIRLKQYFGEDKETALTTVLAQHWKSTAGEFCDANGVNLLVAHLYFNKRGAEILEEPDGEKPIKIGTADLLYSDIIPNEIQYTALGHLHGFRNIGSEENPVVYSSSLAGYSFSETSQKKSVTIIDAEPNKPVKLRQIPITKGFPLHRKTFTDVQKAVEWLSENQNSLVELTMETDTFLTSEERRQIQQSHPGIIHLIPKIAAENAEILNEKSVDISQDITTLFTDYFKAKNGGQNPSGELLQLFSEIKNSSL